MVTRPADVVAREVCHEAEKARLERAEVMQRDFTPNKKRRGSDFSGGDSIVSIENRDLSLSARHALVIFPHSGCAVVCPFFPFFLLIFSYFFVALSFFVSVKLSLFLPLFLELSSRLFSPLPFPFPFLFHLCLLVIFSFSFSHYADSTNFFSTAP
jgi:hypothetical protein